VECFSTSYRLCVLTSGSLITETIKFFPLINVSCLHFGQNKGKFSSMVSSRSFTLVLLLQMGHNNQLSFFIYHHPEVKTCIIHLIYFDFSLETQCISKCSGHGIRLSISIINIYNKNGCI